MTVISSASGLLAMLEEDHPELQVYALKNLNVLVNQFWAEISANISTIESLYEDETFEHRELAALLASKVFYYLGELNEALTYALCAANLFDVAEESEYVQTLISKCIDEYIDVASKRAESRDPDGDHPLDPRLVTIVEKMLDGCIASRQYQQAIGVALECHRLDKLEAAVASSNYSRSLLAYCLQVSQSLVNRRQFRQKVLSTLVRLYQQAPSPDLASICQCLMFLNDAAAVADILLKLLKGSQDEALLAYQVAFDLFDNEMHHFLLAVRDRLPDPTPPPPPAPAAPPTLAPTSDSSLDAVPSTGTGTADAAAAPGTDAAGAAGEGASAMETEGGEGQGAGREREQQGGEAGSDAATAAEPATAAAAVDVAGSAANDEVMGGSAPAARVEAGSEKADEEYAERVARLKGVLSGETPIGLTLQFLYSHRKSDVSILSAMKSSVEARNSVCHTAIISSNAFMHAGTTVDTFLRENLEWLSRATNWSKFSATAGLGVIHRGHLQQGRSLMAPYLPHSLLSAAGGGGGAAGAGGAGAGGVGGGGGAGGGGGGGSPFSEGGALYALGLIYAGHGESIRQFLLESLRNTSNETIQHGACLGLGLSSLGSCDEEAFEDIKSVLYTDSAVAGEAAGLAMGLLLCGSLSDKAAEMLAYAHDTQHEKIIRGLATGIALVVYGREEEADPLILQLTSDADPLLRHGGMYALALAYRGTANNAAVRQLLHFAVSDVSDDVRRAAVMALGFVLYSEPEQVPRIVSLLAESYNPHVRYGAAMAVGIACAGSALRSAVDLLLPLASDAVHFVRQGALMALAMVLMQCSEAREPRVVAFRQQLQKVVSDKHEDSMAKMGAIIAAGILDAGGRNATISLRSRAGFNRVSAVVGLALFTHHWYWFPLLHFLSLAFTPTAFIGLQAKLKAPAFSFLSDCKPSLFAYPPAASATAGKDTAAKAPVAVLSTAARAKGRKEGKKEVEGGKGGGEGSKMEVSEEKKEDGKVGKGKESEDVASGGDAMQVEQAEKEPEPEPEPTSEVLQNPARVLPAQERYIRFSEDSRYTPICKAAAGFVLLKDNSPELPEELALTEAPVTAGTAARTGGAQRTTGRSTAAADAAGGGTGVHAAARAAVRGAAGTAGGGAGGGGAGGGGAGGSGARAAPPRSTEEEEEDEPAPPESFDYK